MSENEKDLEIYERLRKICRKQVALKCLRAAIKFMEEDDTFLALSAVLRVKNALEESEYMFGFSIKEMECLLGGESE